MDVGASRNLYVPKFADCVKVGNSFHTQPIKVSESIGRDVDIVEVGVVGFDADHEFSK